MLFERGANGVEFSDDLEELAERRLPGVAVVVGANAVDQRQAGPAGPAQDGHLGFVFGAVGHRTVHHVDDACALNQRGQQFALVGKAAIVPVLGDEGPHGFGVIGGAQAVGLEPFQHPPRPLEPGGVDQGVQGLAVHAQGVGLTLAGGARLQRDGDGVVLGQGGHDTGLALVGMADHGKHRGPGHGPTPEAA